MQTFMLKRSKHSLETMKRKKNKEKIQWRIIILRVGHKIVLIYLQIEFLHPNLRFSGIEENFYLLLCQAPWDMQRSGNNFWISEMTFVASRVTESWKSAKAIFQFNLYLL